MSSSFSERVYAVVKKIQKGKTLSYKRVAMLAGSPTAYRAVGNVLNRNKNPEIPCHRVIRANGKAGGYNGIQGKKEALLRNEGALA